LITPYRSAIDAGAPLQIGERAGSQYFRDQQPNGEHYGAASDSFQQSKTSMDHSRPHSVNNGAIDVIAYDN